MGELPLEAEEFLVWLTSERGRARNTLTAYRRDLGAYHDWLRRRGTTMTAVTTDDLIDLVGELRRGPGESGTQPLPPVPLWLRCGWGGRRRLLA